MHVYDEEMQKYGDKIIWIPEEDARILQVRDEARAAMGKTSSAEFGTSYGFLFGEFLNFFLTRAIGQKSAPRILQEQILPPKWSAYYLPVSRLVRANAMYFIF